MERGARKQSLSMMTCWVEAEALPHTMGRQVPFHTLRVSIVRNMREYVCTQGSH